MFATAGLEGVAVVDGVNADVHRGQNPDDYYGIEPVALHPLPGLNEEGFHDPNPKRTKHDEQWEMKFNRLVVHKGLTGNCNVPQVSAFYGTELCMCGICSVTVSLSLRVRENWAGGS